MATETREGYTFNNPNTTSSFYAPSWGELITADEIRYNLMYGNPLVAEADNMTMTDDQLRDYGRLCLAWLERELNIDILPRLIRYQDPIDENGDEETRTDIDDSAYLATLSDKQLNQLYIRELGYTYRVIPARNELFIKLRRRPVRDVLNAKFMDPYSGTEILDLMPYRVVKKGLSGICHFRPRYVSGRANSYFYLWTSRLTLPLYRSLQDVFKIDYTTGYASCNDVPDDLRWVLNKITSLHVMTIYGIGKLAAIASRSVSLNSVSESISTTQSATSDAFGAQKITYQKEIKDWMKENKHKYSRSMFGYLG